MDIQSIHYNGARLCMTKEENGYKVRLNGYSRYKGPHIKKALSIYDKLARFIIGI